MDCAPDANFADMYLHPQETSYNLERLLRFAGSAGLHFAGFSNPEVWDPGRLLSGELLERARALPAQQQWALVEELDPDISHFEFFLAKTPVQPRQWSDAELEAATAIRQPCLWGEPDPILGKNMEPLQLSDEDRTVLAAVTANPQVPLGQLAPAALLRQLVDRQLILLQG